eukprot:scaffold78201_cov46-Phaeocystis_antarctica.AAC.2
MARSSEVEPGGLYVPRRRMLTFVASMISCCVDFFVSAALFGQSLISMSMLNSDEPPAPPPPLSASFIFFSASAAAACVAARISSVAPPGDGASWAAAVSSTLSPQRFRFRFGSSPPVAATSVGASAPVSRDARKASVVAAAPASVVGSASPIGTNDDNAFGTRRLVVGESARGAKCGTRVRVVRARAGDPFFLELH